VVEVVVGRCMRVGVNGRGCRGNVGGEGSSG